MLLLLSTHNEIHYIKKIKNIFLIHLVRYNFFKFYYLKYSKKDVYIYNNYQIFYKAQNMETNV